MGLFEQDIRDNMTAGMGDRDIPAIRPAVVQTRQRGTEEMLQNTTSAENGEQTNALQSPGGQHARFAEQYSVYDGARHGAPEETALSPTDPVTAQTVLRELARTIRRTDRLLVTGQD